MTTSKDWSASENSPIKQSKSVICAGVLLLADLGYVGIDKFHACSRVPHRKKCGRGLTKEQRQLTPEQRLENRALSRLRIVIEHVNRRLKVFKILGERYRNRGRRFGLRFNLICAIHNYEYVRHPLPKEEKAKEIT
jgi:hypothetical protein